MSERLTTQWNFLCVEFVYNFKSLVGILAFALQISELYTLHSECTTV